MKIKSAFVSIPEIDMTPMIDIVFQLITFFMVINNFDQNEADERITLPRDQLARPPVAVRKNSFMLNFRIRHRCQRKTNSQYTAVPVLRR